TYTGATTVGAGVLRAGITNALGTNSAVSIATGATLDLNGFNQTVGSFAGGGAIALGSGTLTTGGDNSSTLFSGTIAGAGALDKNGTGTLALSGTSTYTGGTTVNAGTLLGNSASLQGNIFNNASVVFDQSAAGTYAGNMNGSGALTKAGAGTLTMTGTNTYTGGTTVAAGTLIGTTSSVQGAIANNGVVVFNQNTTGTYAGTMTGSGVLASIGP